MKINLEQKTPAWFKHRQKYINATEIGSITGLDPFRSMEQLVHDKLFGTTFQTNKYVEYGNQMEPLARQFIEKQLNLTFEPVIFIDDQYQRFSASLDGYNEQTNTLLEIKCPYVDENNHISSTWTLFLANPCEKTIPLYYWAQVQCQLFCSRAKHGYFLVYFKDTYFHVVKVTLNQAFIQKMYQASEQYLKLLTNAKIELAQSTYLKTLSKFKK
ncbi:MAG: YqaJ viral recombinase family protein [Pigeon pea little leaf phytoplasma]|nr:YqaJ viral recombinase family protein [Pigeon pea little leaf phytoplasma]MDV3189009.1 YqaJ viral recombinase family protein [Pigeon pea little leaf phytoplasma]